MYLLLLTISLIFSTSMIATDNNRTIVLLETDVYFEEDTSFICKPENDNQFSTAIISKDIKTTYFKGMGKNRIELKRSLKPNDKRISCTFTIIQHKGQEAYQIKSKRLDDILTLIHRAREDSSPEKAGPKRVKRPNSFIKVASPPPKRRTLSEIEDLRGGKILLEFGLFENSPLRLLKGHFTQLSLSSDSNFFLLGTNVVYLYNQGNVLTFCSPHNLEKFVVSNSNIYSLTNTEHFPWLNIHVVSEQSIRSMPFPDLPRITALCQAKQPDTFFALTESAIYKFIWSDSSLVPQLIFTFKGEKYPIFAAITDDQDRDGFIVVDARFDRLWEIKNNEQNRIKIASFGEDIIFTKIVALTYCSSTNKVYVADAGQKLWCSVDLSGNKITSEAVSTTPIDIAVRETTGTVYVLAENDELYRW